MNVSKWIALAVVCLVAALGASFWMRTPAVEKMEWPEYTKEELLEPVMADIAYWSTQDSLMAMIKVNENRTLEEEIRDGTVTDFDLRLSAPIVLTSRCPEVRRGELALHRPSRRMGSARWALDTIAVLKAATGRERCHFTTELLTHLEEIHQAEYDAASGDFLEAIRATFGKSEAENIFQQRLPKETVPMTWKDARGSLRSLYPPR